MTPSFSLLLATTNRGKVAELSALFEGAGVSLMPLRIVGRDLPPVVEDGDTFLANALISLEEGDSTKPRMKKLLRCTFRIIAVSDPTACS